jgi:mannosyltransferase
VLIIVALLAWAAAWREAAFMTAIAVGPVAAVWLVSQGSYSYFFPRYLLFTVGAWAILAGIGLSRLDARIAAMAVLVIAVLGAGDQQVVREPGAHSWPSYPVGSGGSYLEYEGAAAFVARQAKAGDGIVYQGQAHGVRWLMIGYGLQYYLARDMPNGVPVPRELFVAETAASAGTLYPVPCPRPASCLGQEPRIWVVASGYRKNPYYAMTQAQATLLRPRYRLSVVKHVPSLTVFLLTRAPSPGRG